MDFTVSAFDSAKFGPVAVRLRKRTNSDDPTSVKLLYFVETKISTAGEVSTGWEKLKNFFSYCAGFLVQLFIPDKDLKKQLKQLLGDTAPEPIAPSNQASSQEVVDESIPAPASAAADPSAAEATQVTPNSIREQIRGMTADKVMISTNQTSGGSASFKDVWNKRVAYAIKVQDQLKQTNCSPAAAFEIIREKVVAAIPDTLDSISSWSVSALPEELVTGAEGDSLASRFTTTIGGTLLEGMFSLDGWVKPEDYEYANNFLSLMHDACIFLQDEAKRIAEINGMA
jgi:hypothetical protein